MDEREEGKVAVKLCGQTYMISAHFSMNDMELYFKVLEDEESARNAVTAVIYRKLQKCEPPIPTQDALRLENDNAFEPYVKAVIENDETLQDLYDQTDVSLPMIERFALANKLFCKDCTQNIVKALQPTLNVIEQINRSFDFSWIRNIQQITNLYQPVIDRALIQTTRIAQQTAEMFAPIQNTIRQFNDTVANVIANIQVGDIFGIGRVNCHDSLLTEKSVKSWNGTGVTTLHEFEPEDNKTGIEVTSAHVEDQFDFFRSMLVRVVMWSAGAVPERLQGTVIMPFPTIDVLAVGFILDSSLSNTKSFSILT